eukprot:TRINITY_DN8460_c0_g1_i1.p1 TRINITY_DN8460_c0_g1~~TRINITY_DN8460_c0_g1_i1.p1  ORF type:complete len:234 (-),score=35.04 TRINITY_DN8460_c0_g1_i1:474-1175(-)
MDENERKKLQDTKFKLLTVAAAKRRDWGTVMTMLQCPIADVNFRDGSGSTLLHFAVFQGDTNMVKFLLSVGADLSYRNYLGQNYFHVLLSSPQPNFETAKLLMELGFRIEDQDIHGSNCIHLAAEMGNLKFLQFCFDQMKKENLGLEKKTKALKEGSNVNNSLTSLTPLHLALHGNHIEVVKLLLEFGADINTTILFFVLLGMDPIAHGSNEEEFTSSGTFAWFGCGCECQSR